MRGQRQHDVRIRLVMGITPRVCPKCSLYLAMSVPYMGTCLSQFGTRVSFCHASPVYQHSQASLCVVRDPSFVPMTEPEARTEQPSLFGIKIPFTHPTPTRVALAEAGDEAVLGSNISGTGESSNLPVPSSPSTQRTPVWF